MNKTMVTALVLFVLALLWTFGGPRLGGFGTVEVAIMLVLWIAVVATFLAALRRRRATRATP
jgi:hypothetical protein